MIDFAKYYNDLAENACKDTRRNMEVRTQTEKICNQRTLSDILRRNSIILPRQWLPEIRQVPACYEIRGML